MPKQCRHVPHVPGQFSRSSSLLQSEEEQFASLSVTPRHDPCVGAVVGVAVIDALVAPAGETVAGPAVGVAVGALVGAAVGVAVGAAVGANVG